MNQFTYLIPFILLVYGSCEVVSYNQSEPKNETEICNSTQIMSNHFINTNKIDALLLGSENFTETSKRNTSKNSNETFKRNENLITSKLEDEEPISFTRSTLSVPSGPTFEEDTTKNKGLALQKRSITKWKKVTKKTFVSLNENAETISNIAVISESTASTSTSPSNTSQGKLTTKSEKATTKIFVSSEEGVVETTTKISVPSEVGVTYIFSSESTSTASASSLSTLQEKSTKKRKEITTKVFVSLEAGANGTTQTLPSESTTSIFTSPSNTSNTDAKYSLVAKMISKAFPTTVSIQTSPTINKRFILESFQQETFEPALCDIGHYGGSSCSYSCEACIGKLCDKNGNCRFENVGLHCDNFGNRGCRIDLELKRNFESKETLGSLIINYKATFNNNHSILKLMYWTYENNKFKYQEGPTNYGGYKELLLNYNTFYVVCVLLYQNNYLANVKCQTSYVCSRCIENLSNVNIYQKNVVWKKKDWSDLLHYELHYSFRNGSCGQPSKIYFIHHSNLATYPNPHLKGTWKICVVCKEEEEEGLENFCNVKESYRIHNFVEETLKVTALTVEKKNFGAEVSWTVPESWTLNCANVSFKLKVQSKTFNKTELYSCSWSHCFSNFNNLSNGFYTFEITPIFGEIIEGSSSSQSINISNCPKELIRILAVEENGEIFVNWYDSNDNIQGLYYTMWIDTFELCKNPTNLRYIELEGRKKEFNFTKIKSTFGLVIKVKPWVEGCPTLRFEPSTLKYNETVPLLLENFKVSLVEDSVKLTWEIPSQWKHVCVTKHFIVRLTTIYSFPYKDSRVNQSEICDDLTCTYIWENELQPFRIYTFKVFTLFENQVIKVTAPMTIVTQEAHPKIPETPVTKSVKDGKVSINYNLKSYMNTLHNKSCQLTFHEMNSDEVQPQLFDCTNGKGKVKIESFRKGRHYNVGVEICNTRSCSRKSRVLEFWTAPEKPTFKEQIVISSSVNNKITLLFPSYKKQQKGNIYIVVIKGDASTLNISDIEDFVKGKNEPPQTTRTRRSIQEDVKPDIMVVEIVDINSEKYELKAEKVFKENETRTAISVAAVFAPEAGELRSYGSTGIIGPITFPSVGEPRGGDTDSWVAWLMVCLLILVGGSVGLSIYQRRKSALSFKDILKIRIPENERVETGEHVSNSPKEDKDSSANMRQDMKRPSITESALALFTSKAESSASLEDTSFNAPLCDESTPECDVYANIEPNRPYIEGLEFYLLQASYSPSLEKEFRSIPVTAHGKTFQEGVRSENRLKNRYQNNIPYDDTRVVLPLLDGIPYTDYINANIVQLTTGKSGDYSTYILTQGPIKRWGVISDFWRMVWYENVSAIVMLTNLIESGKMKCDQYWPEEGDECKCKDEIIVTVVSVEIRNSFVIRTFTISKDEEVRQVVQYHYTDWPDHGVPVEASPIANMVNLVRSYHPYGPTVVHCSAGIGRTGCFVLVNMCLEEYQLYNPIDFKKSLLFLRKCRSKLVQNFAQYQFSHYLLWVILFESTTTYLTSEFPFKWRNEIQNLEQEDPNDPRALSKQFQKLKTFQNNLTYFVAMDKDIRYKYNRFKNILPADSKRVSLLSVDGRPQDLYINAIMVDGFSKKDGYIVAEYPMESTIVRVWYMILERQIPVWIFLNDMTESLDDTYPPIVPTADVPFEFGELNVSLLSSTSHEYFIENWVKIEGNFQGSETLAFECRVIQFLGWSSSSIVPETGPEQLFSMLDYIYSGGPYNSPLLFTCADGVTACGAALALDITRQRSEAFGEVNIFSSCIRIINCRPEFIVSLEQYCLLHDYIASYILLSDQEIYENIQIT